MRGPSRGSRRAGLFTQRAAAQQPQEKRDDLDVTMQIIVDPDAKLPDEVVRRIPLPARKSADPSSAAGAAATGNSGNSDNNGKSDKPDKSDVDKERNEASNEHAGRHGRSESAEPPSSASYAEPGRKA